MRRGASKSAVHFGRWFQQQRELRGISVWFVAARVKLLPERVREIEDDSAGLKLDGHGRAVARALSRAIGADPDEGVARLKNWSASVARERRARRMRSALRLGRPAALVVALSLVAWGVAIWLELVEAPGESPALIYKPNYVERLLKEE